MEPVENRYPFDNFVEFFSDGYAFNLSGLHLNIAFIALAVGFILSLKKNEGSVVCTFSMLYFALQPFNNPAFSLAGITIADVFGIIVAAVCFGRFLIFGVTLNRFIAALAFFIVTAAVHATLIWNIYPEFGREASLASRYSVILKAALLPLVFTWIYTTQNIYTYLTRLVSIIAGFTLVICIIYLIQLAIFFTGTVPYGTFAGAGFSITVAFGGVSIERGHLSKHMASIFVPMVINSYLSRRLWSLYLYFLIMAINFSASGIGFLGLQVFIGVLLFWPVVGRWIVSVRGVLTLCTAGAIIFSFSSAYGAIIEKVYRLVILGDESDQGGRSISLLIHYLVNYPFGVGYSGSTFRTAPGLPEINMGIYAFISQMSYLAPVYLVLIFLALVSLVYTYRDGTVVSKILLIGSLSIPFVFSSDILWFGPLWWLPFFLLASYRYVFVHRPDDHWIQQQVRAGPLA
jgi:hypothetical protein